MANRRRRSARKAPKQTGGDIRFDAPTSEAISFYEDDENIYAQSVDAGHRIDPRAQKIFIIVAAVLAVFAIGLVIPKDMLNSALHDSGYSSGYTFSWFVEDLQKNMSGLFALFAGHPEEAPTGATGAGTIFRYIVIILSGGGLALCGAVYQGTFRNALVSPSSMGVMSGSSAGLILWLLFYVNDECTNVPWASNLGITTISNVTTQSDPLEYLWASYSLSIYEFLGCAVVAGLVLLVMALSRKNTTSGLMIIITGQVFGGLLGSFTTCVRYYMSEFSEYEAKLELLNGTTIGSFFRDYTLIDVVAVLIPLLACFFVIMHLRQRMIALSLGKEEARSMGVETKRMQLAIIGVSTLLTAIIISFCGSVGFVGFLVPHLARRMVGPNFKYLLPASIAIGALFVLSAFILVSATLGSGYESMTGMFISIGGATVFLVQALRGLGDKGGGMNIGFPN